MKIIRTMIILLVSLLAGLITFLLGCYVFVSVPEEINGPDASFDGLAGLIPAAILGMMAIIWVFIIEERKRLNLWTHESNE